MSDRDMTMAAPDKQAPRCINCGRTKIKSDDIGWMCANCDSTSTEKTGQTLVHTNPGVDGPMKWQIVKQDSATGNPLPPAAPAQLVSGSVSTPTQSVQGCISINVPVSLLPELAAFSRKLKMPKNWSEAARLQDVVVFQKQLNDIFQGLAK